MICKEWTWRSACWLGNCRFYHTLTVSRSRIGRPDVISVLFSDYSQGGGGDTESLTLSNDRVGVLGSFRRGGTGS